MNVYSVMYNTMTVLNNTVCVLEICEESSFQVFLITKKQKQKGKMVTV